MIVRLTGYLSHNVIGSNCRFLQVPPGSANSRSDSKNFTDQVTVLAIKNHVASFTECQHTLVNYKADGSAFVNLLTLVPMYSPPFFNDPK